jgi:hypothetical protein
MREHKTIATEVVIGKDMKLKRERSKEELAIYTCV